MDDIDMVPLVRSFADDDLRTGFVTFDELAEKVHANLTESFDSFPVTPAQTRDLLAQVWDERVAEQSTWTTSSDSDRLDAAFAELEAGGILARMNYECCSTCAYYGMQNNRPTNEQGAATGDGYVFFHAQQAERIGYGLLYLGHGSFADTPQADTEVAQRIIEVLTKHGLDASVINAGAAIQVTITDWRRRLPVRPGVVGSTTI